MKFKNSNDGIAVGDPIEGCIQIIKTMDGGETWNQINCETGGSRNQKMRHLA